MKKGLTVRLLGNKFVTGLEVSILATGKKPFYKYSM